MPARRRLRHDHESLQLCRRVERAPHHALLETADPVLQDLDVVRVSAVAAENRLRVEVHPQPGLDPGIDVLARLSA